MEGVQQAMQRRTHGTNNQREHPTPPTGGTGTGLHWVSAGTETAAVSSEVGSIQPRLGPSRYLFSFLAAFGVFFSNQLSSS